MLQRCFCSRNQIFLSFMLCIHLTHTSVSRPTGAYSSRFGFSSPSTVRQLLATCQAEIPLPLCDSTVAGFQEDSKGRVQCSTCPTHHVPVQLASESTPGCMQCSEEQYVKNFKCNACTQCAPLTENMSCSSTLDRTCKGNT